MQSQRSTADSETRNADSETGTADSETRIRKLGADSETKRSAESETI